MKQNFHAMLTEEGVILRMLERGKNGNKTGKEGKQYKLVCCHT